jgi:hypothetical protein
MQVIPLRAHHVHHMVRLLHPDVRAYAVLSGATIRLLLVGSYVLLLLL